MELKQAREVLAEWDAKDIVDQLQAEDLMTALRAAIDECDRLAAARGRLEEALRWLVETCARREVCLRRSQGPL